MSHRRWVLAVVALTSLTAGCRFFRPVQPGGSPQPAKPAATPSKGATTKAATTNAAPAPRAASMSKEPVTDANIAAMVLASNNTDISYARLVAGRSERDDIRAFAQRMLTDHTGVNALVTDLLKKLDLAPEENVTSLDLRDESAEKRDLMRELSGYAFDSTYIENEVAYHRKFLASLDGIMLPRARNAELKSLLGTVRPAVAAHLAHAEQVRANVVARR